MLLDNPVLEVVEQYPVNAERGQLLVLKDRGLRYFDEGRWKSGHNDFDFMDLFQFSGTSHTYTAPGKVTVRSIHIANTSGEEAYIDLRINSTYIFKGAYIDIDQTIAVDLAVPMYLNDVMVVSSNVAVACSTIGSDADDYEIIGIGQNISVSRASKAVITAFTLCNVGEEPTTVSVQMSFDGSMTPSTFFMKNVPVAVGETIFGDIKHIVPAGGRLLVSGVNIHALFSGGIYE